MSSSNSDNHDNDFQNELDLDSDRDLDMDFTSSLKRNVPRTDYFDDSIYENLIFHVSLNDTLKLIFRGTKYVEKIALDGRNLVIENRKDKKLEIDNLSVKFSLKKDDKTPNIILVGNVQINNLNSISHELLYLDYIENSLFLNLDNPLKKLKLCITDREDLKIIKKLEIEGLLSLELILDDFRGYFDSRKITNRREVIPIEFSENLNIQFLEISYSGNHYKNSQPLIELINLPKDLEYLDVDNYFKFISN
jgi:hypothetical protein